MALNLMLLFSFQTRVGALYSQLGLLSALFMMGLTLGGAWASLGRVPLCIALAVSLSCTVCVTLAFVILERTDPPLAVSAFLHGLLLVFAGAATGGLFPAAVHEYCRSGLDTRHSASLVQSADHSGAALAALLVSVLFVSTLGLVGLGILVCGFQSLALIGLCVGSGRSVSLSKASQ